jgi:hypothetical protein
MSSKLDHKSSFFVHGCATDFIEFPLAVRTRDTWFPCTVAIQAQTKDEMKDFRVPVAAPLKYALSDILQYLLRVDPAELTVGRMF